MKIAMVCTYPINEFIPGGVTTHILHMTNRLATIENLELHVITTADEHKTFRRDNIHFHILKSSKRKCLYFYRLKKINNLLSDLKPDIIHMQTSEFYFLVITLKKEFLERAILSIHGIANMECKYERFNFKNILDFCIQKIYCLWEIQAISKIKNIIVPSIYAKNIVEKFNPNCNIKVIPSGVDETYFKINSNEQHGRLLFVGNIFQRKGLFDLVKAIQIVTQKISYVNLHVVGKVISEEYINKINRYITQNMLENNIKFLGYTDNDQLKKEYGEAQLFVFPSYEESLGIVLLEAMASGKAIIASDAASIPYVIDNGINGLLYKCGDILELANKIIELLIDDKRRKQLGATSVEKAKIFNWDNEAYNTYCMYQNICSKTV
jgi:glycosyltransferase involved in cell wall biosynthesis